MSYSSCAGSTSHARGSEVNTQRTTAPHDETMTTASGPGVEALRPRFVEATRERVGASYVKVSIALSFGREYFVGDAEGVALKPIELRLAATATIDALAKATGMDGFHLIGVKRCRAFDADVILVVLRDTLRESRRYVGAAAVRTTYIEGVAAAVLNAFN